MVRRRCDAVGGETANPRRRTINGAGAAELETATGRTGPDECPKNRATQDIGEIAGAENGRPDILDAVEGLPCHDGEDGPESYIPALWSTATGEGLAWPGGSIPDQSCAIDPDEPTPPRGYPCFRPGALPIILLFGDAPFHNGSTYGVGDDYDHDAPGYDETVTALTRIGARVIALEPQPQCMKLLRRWFAGKPDVVLLEQAVGASPGSATLHVSRRTPTVTSLSSDWIDAVRRDAGFANCRA